MFNTRNVLTVLCCVLSFSLYSSAATADNHEPLLDRNLLSIGGGISNNSVSGPTDDEFGLQFFVAYDLDEVNLVSGVRSSVEFGIMDYGFSRDSTGIWGTYVVDGQINSRWQWLARLGFDIGDDNGIMTGVGLGFANSEQVEFRGEYVMRDDIDSLQFNFLYHL
ncbi:MAG: hypothetical protein GY763_05290 [Gammaproteobacteria bacterium]|nr:hypothetical protein [Gammaproteobacteria bacterium]